MAWAMRWNPRSAGWVPSTVASPSAPRSVSPGTRHNLSWPESRSALKTGLMCFVGDVGASHAGPAPAVFVPGVKIESADAGGGHVIHGKGGRGEGPARADGGGVGDEAHQQSGGAAAEIPYRGADDGLRACGQADEWGLRVDPAPAFDFEPSYIIPDQTKPSATSGTSKLRSGFERFRLPDLGGK